MAADDHDLLPEPPPPRPAGRDAAIAAALRRFDGEPNAAPQPRGPRVGSWVRHPQLGLALAASLVVIIGFPAAFVVLRDQGSSPTQVSAPAPRRAVEAAEPPGIAVNEPANAVTAEPPGVSKPVDQLAKVQAAAPPVQSDQRQAVTAEQDVTNDVPAAPPPPPMAAAAPAPPPPAPPPPPPPPPPAPPAVAQKGAEGAANDLVVTGSRIAPANREQRGAAARAERDSSDQPSAAQRAFVTRLQAAVRANDRNAVIALIDLPLRVNSNGRSQYYRTAGSVRSNYERIFTSKVVRAILGQRPGTLFGNQYGWMIGNGAVWFDQTCSNASCSPPGPIRIKSINL